jgi:uncharacterized protein
MSDAKILPYRGAGRALCPSCRKPATAKYRPFCSKRCADLDLHKWLSEGYRVPTDEGPQEESPLDEPDDEEKG